MLNVMILSTDQWKFSIQMKGAQFKLAWDKPCLLGGVTENTTV